MARSMRSVTFFSDQPETASAMLSREGRLPWASEKNNKKICSDKLRKDIF
jgi:hypothetical protein